MQPWLGGCDRQQIESICKLQIKNHRKNNFKEGTSKQLEKTDKLT